ncbi:hypothetical protein [Enterococcus faecium]|uniref:Uncharacterized protein n=1 Tax=Enterococcus faecium TaxID=1352 RepID=A0A2C9X298_ENTFC|nr:hypothetical protein [Enterococcus faecium]OTN87531.1 hypothetical protein A5810_002849 [Enterococcus faecium]
MVFTRQEKRERRRRILEIIGNRSVEELSDQELKSVQAIAETIGADTMDQSKPLPKLDIESFTFEKYSHLREAGYSVNAIRKALGAGSSVWARWRKENIKEGKQND